MPSQVSGPIQFIDDMHGWVVVGGEIFVTSNGGKNWSPQYAGPLEVMGVAFVDAQHGWALSEDGLLKTSDGGSKWIDLGQPGEFLRTMQFVSPEVGWLISGSRGRKLMRTTNGGATWQLVSIPEPADSMCFANGTHGWAASGYRLVRTTDGGQTWEGGFVVEFPGNEAWTATLGCTSNVEEAFLLMRDGGAAGHIAYFVLQATDDGQGSYDVQFVMQEGGTHPLGLDISGVYNSEDPYPGPFTVVGSGSAYFLNWCPACSGSLPSVSITITAGQPSDVTDRFPVVTGDQHGQPRGVTFLPPEGSEGAPVHGWALLEIGDANGFGLGVLETTDGGRTWSSPCGSPPYACFSS